MPDGSPDPVVNTVEVHYHPLGFPNEITDDDSHSLNLFQPSITFDKSADTTLSKIGDVVNYTLTLNNTSSADTPDLVCTITDAAAGREQAGHPGLGCHRRVPTWRTRCQAGDPDPLAEHRLGLLQPDRLPERADQVGRPCPSTCSSRA